MSLHNQTAVITGASRGLGKSLAFALKKAGANIVLFSRSPIDFEEELWDLKPSFGSRVVLVQGDVTNPLDVIRLRSEAQKHFGEIDIWINNAGIGSQQRVENIHVVALKKLFDTNVFGTIYGCRYAYEHMKPLGKGTIVNVISTSGLAGRKEESVYCATKFAVRGFTESLQAEALEHGIQVLPVYQGGMNTTFFDEIRPGMDKSSFLDPDDVAQMIVQAIDTPSNMRVSLEMRRM